ncbi:NIPSNAP family protein [Cognatishimia sp.]|uniref:NIPSNAP family protein n=1 Tax=Cognatishimia sp. TaxID=2211648 RepID=UPI00351500C0
MITCYISYQIDPSQVAAFEAYGKTWIALVERYGGQHHGYFLPHEGPNDLATAAFSFESLAAYEVYRDQIKSDPDCVAAFEFAEKTGCIKRYDRHFLRPCLTGDAQAIAAFKA